ncbi:MAG: hypothetical protein FJX77_13150 [Armatimonadetes bacterium]|nr:hypothetical protein [Armatimonadota bacterium]
MTAPGGTGTLTRYDPDLRVLGSAGAAAGAAALVERRVGSGQAVFLNLAVGEYPRERLHPPGGQPLRTLFAGLLKDAGVTPAVQVLRAADGSPAPAVAVWRYRASGRQVIAVHRNPGYKADEAGAAVNRDTGALDRPEEVEIRLPRRARVEDLHSGTHLTTADRVRLTLNPNRPVVLELAPPSRR